MLISDSTGRLKYGNEAARQAIGTHGLSSDPVGLPVDQILGSRHAKATPLPLAGGNTAWFLIPDSLESVEDAHFALEVGDALAGTLNLRRTLGRIVELAVPRLGECAAVTLWDHDRIRRVVRTAGRPTADRNLLMSFPLRHATVRPPSSFPSHHRGRPIWRGVPAGPGDHGDRRRLL